RRRNESITRSSRRPSAKRTGQNSGNKPRHRQQDLGKPIRRAHDLRGRDVTAGGVAMDAEAALWQALHASPDDEFNWLALADRLEERGQHARADLVRLQHAPGAFPGLTGGQRDEKVRALLASGVLPCVPEIVNSIGMKFVRVPAGTFTMGSPEHEE